MILKKMYLGDNLLKENGAKLIFYSLKKNRSLVHLSMNDNLLSDKGVEHVFQLKSNKTLIKLNLTNNKFGFKGSKFIAQLLTNFDKKHEEFLNFPLTDDTSIRLGKVLKNESFIKNINISKNSLCDFLIYFLSLTNIYLFNFIIILKL